MNSVENLGQILRRIQLSQLSSEERYALAERYTLPAEPECPICKGSGFLSKRIASGQFDYPPCECKLKGRQTALVAYAQLPNGRQCEFQGFRTGDDLEWQVTEAYKAALEFASGAMREHCLTLTGAVGTGKSHLLQAIGWDMLRHGVAVKYVYVPDWLDSLRAAYGDQQRVTFRELYERYRQAQVLLLDDVGAERRTDWTTEILTRTVEHRHQERERLVVATNVRPWDDDARERLGDRLADRLFDCESGQVRLVDTGSRSYRTGKTG